MKSQKHSVNISVGMLMEKHTKGFSKFDDAIVTEVLNDSKIKVLHLPKDFHKDILVSECENGRIVLNSLGINLLDEMKERYEQCVYTLRKNNKWYKTGDKMWGENWLELPWNYRQYLKTYLEEGLID